MKLALFFPLILLIGLVIGGWAPKEELRAAKKEAADLKAQLASREKDSRMDAFTRMVQIPERAKNPRPAPQPAVAAPSTAAGAAATNAAAEAATAASNVASVAQSPADSKKEEVSPEDLRARIDEAKELWKTRVDIARAQLIDKLKLTPEATAQLDASLNAMNTELYTSMQGLADTLAAEDTLTPEVGTRAFSEMTAALVKTYDDLSAIVPEDQRGQVAQVELTDFIDPGVAEPLISVQQKLSSGPGRHRGPFGIRGKR